MDKEMMTDLIGWFSTAVLVYTIGRQVWAQWRTRSTAGVSRWLFIGQLIASTGFVVYSFLVANWVFVVSNVVMLALAILGQCIFMLNRRRAAKAEQSGRMPAGVATAAAAAGTGAAMAAAAGLRPEVAAAARNDGRPA